jgi:hypothetical protein
MLPKSLDPDVSNNNTLSNQCQPIGRSYFLDNFHVSGHGRSMPMQAARRMKRGSAVRAFIHNWSPRECAARAAAATDALTSARFQQEQQQWLTLARAAEQEEREQHGPFAPS